MIKSKGLNTEKYTEAKKPVSFVNDLPNERDKAIIDLATLQRLADNLVGADIKDIVSRFVNTITTLNYTILSIEEFTKLLDDESAFHKTVKSIVEHNNK